MNRSLRSLCGVLLLSTAGAVGAQETAQATTQAAAQDLSAATPAATAPLDRAALSYSNKWRIAFNHEADNDGTLVFRLVMKDQGVAPITVSVPIKKGTNENNAASQSKRALQKAFPKDFNVETDDNESVLVKLNAIEGSSNLSLLSNDVKGLKIKVKKE